MPDPERAASLASDLALARAVIVLLLAELPADVALSGRVVAMLVVAGVVEG